MTSRLFIAALPALKNTHSVYTLQVLKEHASDSVGGESGLQMRVAQQQSGERAAQQHQRAHEFAKPERMHSVFLCIENGAAGRLGF